MYENPIKEVFPKVEIIINVANKTLFNCIILPMKYYNQRLNKIKPINIKTRWKIFSSKIKGYIFENTIAGSEMFTTKSINCFELSW